MNSVPNIEMRNGLNETGTRTIGTLRIETAQ